MAIVLASAFLHAGWNFLLKKSWNKIAFTWCFLTAAIVMYLPVCLYFWPEQPISPLGWACIAGTGLFHFLYFWFMGGAYERGDLSLVYPLFRGSGPLLVPILAVIFLKEELAALGIAGIVLVVLGVYVLHLKSFRVKSFIEPLAALRGGAIRLGPLRGGVDRRVFDRRQGRGVAGVSARLSLHRRRHLLGHPDALCDVPPPS